MSEVLTLGVGAQRIQCRGCGTNVLAARVEGELTVLMDVAEILPRERCRTCLSARLRYARCWRCGAQPWEGDERRWVGEELGGILAVGIDERGVAHVFIGGTRERLAGEAVHRAHRCELQIAA